MDYKKSLEIYYSRSNTGFEFADSEDFMNIATYFALSKEYIQKMEQQNKQLQEKIDKIEIAVKKGIKNCRNTTSYQDGKLSAYINIEEILKEGNDE